MRWFTSDLHVGHLRINELAQRPFSSVDEMDQAIVDRWNSVVSTQDIVYVLGDVALGKIDLSLARISQMNGHKVLVPGNHDRVFSGNKSAYIQRFWPVYHRVFSQIWPEQSLFMMRSGRVVRLCHFPLYGDSGVNDRYVDKRPPVSRTPLLHGHTHRKEKISGPLSFHVGVDAHDFTPVSEDEIEAWLTTIQ